MTEKRVRNIIWRQVFLYLIAGIFLGVLLGIVTGIDYRESEMFRMNVQYKSVLCILGYFLLLAFLLRKKIQTVVTIF